MQMQQAGAPGMMMVPVGGSMAGMPMAGGMGMMMPMGCMPMGCVMMMPAAEMGMGMASMGMSMGLAVPMNGGCGGCGGCSGIANGSGCGSYGSSGGACSSAAAALVDTSNGSTPGISGGSSSSASLAVGTSGGSMGSGCSMAGGAASGGCGMGGACGGMNAAGMTGGCGTGGGMAGGCGMGGSGMGGGCGMGGNNMGNPMNGGDLSQMPVGQCFMVNVPVEEAKKLMNGEVVDLNALTAKKKLPARSNQDSEGGNIGGGPGEHGMNYDITGGPFNDKFNGGVDSRSGLDFGHPADRYCGVVTSYSPGGERGGKGYGFIRCSSLHKDCWFLTADLPKEMHDWEQRRVKNLSLVFSIRPSRQGKLMARYLEIGALDGQAFVSGVQLMGGQILANGKLSSPADGARLVGTIKSVDQWGLGFISCDRLEQDILFSADDLPLILKDKAMAAPGQILKAGASVMFRLTKNEQGEPKCFEVLPVPSENEMLIGVVTAFDMDSEYGVIKPSDDQDFPHDVAFHRADVSLASSRPCPTKLQLKAHVVGFCCRLSMAGRPTARNIELLDGLEIQHAIDTGKVLQGAVKAYSATCGFGLVFCNALGDRGRHIWFNGMELAAELMGNCPRGTQVIYELWIIDGEKHQARALRAAEGTRPATSGDIPVQTSAGKRPAEDIGAELPDAKRGLWAAPYK